jgi:pilus assembly protein CpaB
VEQNETRTLWISIASAVFAVILLYGWAQDKRATMARKFGQTKTVVVAREDIQEMEIINEAKLEVVEKPSDFIQPSAIQNPTEIVGQIALAPMKKGEQILDTKLVFPNESTGLSFQISPGKRAVSISVNEVQGVSKLIKPGDRVDIIAGVDDGQGINKVRKVRTILQNVPVLATGQNIVDNLPIKLSQSDGEEIEIQNLRVSNNYSTITVEVAPSEAQQLVYLQSITAPINFTLRNPNDRATSLLRTAEIHEVLARKRKRSPAKAPVKKKAEPQKQAPQPKPKRRGRYEEI